jgi:L-cysteate sulfo-lyase
MVVADCDYVGAGYGLVDEAVIEALKLAARTDGIVLDPVYTGKAMKGLIALARAGRFENETVVFLHTGGAQGLFGYQGEIEGCAVGTPAPHCHDREEPPSMAAPLSFSR